MNKLYTLIGIAVCCALFGCSDDKSPKDIAKGACKSMASCAGYDTSEAVSVCTDILMEYYEEAPGCEDQATAYVECVEDLSCREQATVFENYGEYIPSACNNKFNKLSNCWNGGGSNGSFGDFSGSGDFSGVW